MSIVVIGASARTKQQNKGRPPSSTIDASNVTLSFIVYCNRPYLGLFRKIDYWKWPMSSNICTWFAPKNKVFAGSFSLHNRIGLAMGINSIGVLEYFKRLCRKLGITMTDNVVHYLTIKEANRVKKHDKQRQVWQRKKRTRGSMKSSRPTRRKQSLS
jgi:hypothetical protein